MIPTGDRLKQLLNQNVVAGIDFIHVTESQDPEICQKKLAVWFFQSQTNRPKSLLEHAFTCDQILITSLTPTKADPVPVAEMEWAATEENILFLTTSFPGDFTRYRLRIESSLIDPYYNDIIFSFKANCPTLLDCKKQQHVCPAETPDDFPMDYMARDFRSFRRALLDFASLRYPGWKDRLEADAGVMLAEVMSALADEMAYYQDRTGREAYLESASQRRSVRKHARLVDYHLHDGAGASGWLDVTVVNGQKDSLPAGTDAWLTDNSGRRINFEVGNGLKDIALDGTRTEYPVNSAANEFDIHLWDEDDTCLKVGETSVHITGHHTADIRNFDDTAPSVTTGKWVLLSTQTQGTSIRPRSHMVRITGVTGEQDLVRGVNITRLTWDPAQALPFEMDMRYLKVRCNMVPCVAGKTYGDKEPEHIYFTVGTDPSQLDLPSEISRKLHRAVERQGHDDSVEYFFSLENSDAETLVWTGDKFPENRPEVKLIEESFINGSRVVKQEWNWKRSFLGVNSSFPQDRQFSLDDGYWRQVVKYPRTVAGEFIEIVHEDYQSGKGVTIRFGDNEFGMTPPRGTIFRVIYRLGGGKPGNVAANTIVNIENPSNLVEKVTNPFPIVNGIDPESLDHARLTAPEAFRAITYRAVRPEDYAEAVERLDGIQKAGAGFRWTGSWLTAFVTPDPAGTVTLTQDTRIKISGQLDRFRQAGREAFVMDPVYASLDLHIEICVSPDSYQGEVRQRVLEKLFGKNGARPVTGYFSPDHFTFGTSLDRSSLEASIQSVEGVRMVERIFIRRRGWFNKRPFHELSYDPGTTSIIRIENNPEHPDRGTVKLTMKGGA